MQQHKLYVGHCPYSVDEAPVRSLFSASGEISDLAMIMDSDTRRAGPRKRSHRMARIR